MKFWKPPESSEILCSFPESPKFPKAYFFLSFQTREAQLKSLLKQMNEMQQNLQGMAKLKHQLHEKSDDFRRDLVLLLVGRSTVRENDFTHVIGKQKS